MVPVPPPSYSAKTVRYIEQAKHVFIQIASLAPDSAGFDERAALVMAFGSMAMEHFRSIVMLVESRVALGSALALFRPLLDAIIRGEWLYFCASDLERRSFLERKLQLDSSPFRTNKPGKQDMARELDVRLGLTNRFELYAPFYSQMCDYTHTGHEAVARRISSDGGIEPSYPESQIRSLLSHASMAVVLHYEILCDALGEQERLDALVQLFAQIEPERPS